MCPNFSPFPPPRGDGCRMLYTRTAWHWLWQTTNKPYVPSSLRARVQILMKYIYIYRQGNSIKWHLPLCCWFHPFFLPPPSFFLSIFTVYDTIYTVRAMKGLSCTKGYSKHFNHAYERQRHVASIRNTRFETSCFIYHLKPARSFERDRVMCLPQTRAPVTCSFHDYISTGKNKSFDFALCLI